MTHRVTTCVVVDLGAGSGRVMLARHADDRLDLDEVHRFEGNLVERADGPHWNFPRIFAEVETGLHRARAEAGRIDSVGIDSWGLDYALLDAAGALGGEPAHYRHPRSQRGFEACPLAPEALFARTGSQILLVNTVYQLTAEARVAPERHAAAARLLMTADAVAHHLTGDARAELTLARTSGLVDARTGTWSDEIARGIGLDSRLLPPLIAPGQIRGHLRAELGLGPVPVIAVAAHDTASAVAALSLAPDRGFLILGSWSLLGAETPGIDLRPEVRAAGFGNEGGAGAVPGFLVRSLNGLQLVQKLRDGLRGRGQDLSFTEIASAAAAAPDGPAIDPSDPAFFNPPDIFAAISAACGPAVAADAGLAARAIYRGLAAQAAAATVGLERLLGRPLVEIRACGGGTQDALLCRLVAEATGKPLVIGPAEASAWGNAIVQLVGLGALASIEAGRTLVARSVKCRRIEPETGDAGRHAGD